MGEIAILHAPDSRALSCRLAAQLAAEGHSVLRRESGAATATAYAETACQADAVMVVWSPAMSDHPAMIDAARRALARRALVPARVLDVEPPASLAHLWPIDLDGWNGETADPRWQFVCDEIALALRRSELTLGRVGETAQPGAAAQPSRAPAIRARAAAAPARFRFVLPAALRRPPLRSVAPAAAGLAALTLAVGVFAAQQAARHAARSAAPPASPDAAAPAPLIAYVEPVDPPGSSAPDIPAPEERLQVAVPAPPEEDGPSAPEAAAVWPAADGRDVAAMASDVRGEAAAPAAGIEPDETRTPPTGGASGARSAAPDDAPPPILVAALAPPSPPPDDFAGVVFRDCLECPDMTDLPAKIDAAGAAVVRPFAMSRREITHDEWRACVAGGGCRPLPAPAGGGKAPAVNVAYGDAAAYAAWLSAKTGFAYRLPTAAEWAFAAGAPGGLAPGAANLAGGAWGAALPAGSFRPSANGLYDMIGNVWEWTSDCAPDGDCASRVLKGGAYDVAFAGGAVPTTRRNAGARSADAGFRIVRSAP